MDAFLAKLSHHTTSFVIRSCLALTSSYVVNQSSKLLQTKDDEPFRAEVARLQSRLERKIKLIAPVLLHLESRHNQGDGWLEPAIQVVRELRDDIGRLSNRAAAAAAAALTAGAHADSDDDGDDARGGTGAVDCPQRAEMLAVVEGIKDLIFAIDDAVPLLHMWVSATGGLGAFRPEGGRHQQGSPPQLEGQSPLAALSFSPLRFAQASWLVNVVDTQYLLDPGERMQVGPEFTLSLYMHFKSHVSHGEDPYGVEEGQPKPRWQEVIHKTRARLYRAPHHVALLSPDGRALEFAQASYAYELQLVEDLDDGRVHTLEPGQDQPEPFAGVARAGIRELIPVGELSDINYVDMGQILNIHSDQGLTSSPVLLLKRHVSSAVPFPRGPRAADPARRGILETTENEEHDAEAPEQPNPNADAPGQPNPNADADNETPSSTGEVDDREPSPQDDIDRQLREESEAAGAPAREDADDDDEAESVAPSCEPPAWKGWKLPPSLDPEWIALEVLESHGDGDDDDDEDDDTGTEDNSLDHVSATKSLPPPSAADPNLVSQMQRMSLVSAERQQPAANGVSHVSGRGQAQQQHQQQLGPLEMLANSPFGPIEPTLSLLDMLLRLVSLQEAQQTTHLDARDDYMNFYLGQSKLAAKADGAARQG